MHLVDTNVLSELRKPSPNSKVVDWYRQVETESLYVSVLVIGELRYGAERLRRRDPERSTRLAEWLADLRGQFAERVLPVSEPVAEAWGRLRAHDPLPVVDALQAATALVHGFVVVSRDTTTAARVGVPWLDPWSYGEP
jgi:predicted nucleic acid-binding protein